MMPLSSTFSDPLSRASRTQSPCSSSSAVFSRSDSPQSRASTPDPLKHFRDLPDDVRRRIWELQIEPRVVEVYPCQLRKTNLELWEEKLMSRPGELPRYTVKKLGPLARKRCHNLQQRFTKDNCKPERLNEVEGLYSMVNKAMKFMASVALIHQNSNYLFDLQTIIHIFLTVKIPLDYVPALLGWTRLELISFIKLTIPANQRNRQLFKWKYGGNEISEDQYQQSDEPIWALRTNSSIPSVLLVCRESHEIAMRHYDNAFIPYQTAPGIYFAFQKDTLLFRSDRLNGTPYPKWVYDQAWPQAFGHFEQTFRRCHDYEKLAMLLENVSVIMHPGIEALHGCCNTLCLGKVHEMFPRLKSCFLRHAPNTETDEDLQESISSPVLDCDEAWKSYNKLTHPPWRFKHQPSFEVFNSLDKFPHESAVLDKGDNCNVAVVWKLRKDPGVFRIHDDIAAARVPCQKIILHTQWQTEQKTQDFLSKSGSEIGTSNFDASVAEEMSTDNKSSDIICKSKQETEKPSKSVSEAENACYFRTQLIVLKTKGGSRAWEVPKHGSTSRSRPRGDVRLPKLSVKKRRFRAYLMGDAVTC